MQVIMCNAGQKMAGPQGQRKTFHTSGYLDLLPVWKDVSDSCIVSVPSLKNLNNLH